MQGLILKSWDPLVSPIDIADSSFRNTTVSMAVDSGSDILDDQTEMAIQRADSRSRLGRVRQRTLVLTRCDEQVRPLAVHEELASGIPTPILQVIEYAGHFAPLENPMIVGEHAGQWFDQI